MYPGYQMRNGFGWTVVQNIPHVLTPQPLGPHCSKSSVVTVTEALASVLEAVAEYIRNIVILEYLATKYQTKYQIFYHLSFGDF